MHTQDTICPDHNKFQMGKLKSLMNLASLINSSMDENVILYRSIDAAITLLNAEEGSIMLIDRTTNQLFFDVVAGKTGDRLREIRVRLDQGIAGWVATNGAAQIVNDVSQDPRFFSGADKSADFTTRSIIAVPLLLHDRVLGVLEAVNKIDGEFTEEDLELFSSLANLVASAVENSNLHEKLRDSFYDTILVLADTLGRRDTFTSGHPQRRTAIQTKERVCPDHDTYQIEKSRSLMDLAALINSSLDENVIRCRAIEAAKTLLNAEEGSMMLIDRTTNELYFDVVAGESGDQLREVRIGLDQGIAGWVATNRIGQIINDVSQDPRFFGGADKLSNFKTRSIIAVPLVAHDKVLGVLEAVNKIDGEFTEEDLELFSSLANLVATMVENSNLHEELRASFYDTVLVLADALESRDRYTGGHTKRVMDYSMVIGVSLGLDKIETEILALAAMLHDIGKIGVKDSILCKEGPFTTEEALQMSEHSRKGADILTNVRALKHVIPSVLSHHCHHRSNLNPFCVFQ